MRDNIIVYGSTKERACYKLQQLLDDMKYGDIANVKRSKSEFIIVLKNENIYKAVGASDSSRGIKWQYAYIDSTIDKNLVDNVILPSFIPKMIDGEYDINAKMEDRITWY